MTNDARVNKPTEALAEFAASLTYDDIPTNVIATSKRVILDALGCALAATTLGDGCRETLAVMNSLGGRPESTIIGSPTKVAAPHAAFANGALVHSLNFDPIGQEIGHIGVVCLPAPLAMAEARGRVSGRDFLAACVAACEVCARVNAAIAHSGGPVADKFLNGQTLSYFAAAAGAGRAYGLNQPEMHSAFALALMQIAGTRQVVMQGDPPAKAIYGAFPNQAGVLSALLAKEGLHANCDVFGNPAGLYAMIYKDKYDSDALTSGLGDEFLFGAVEFKLRPVSRHVGMFIAAATEIFRSGLPTSEIAEVEVTLPSRLRPWCEPIEQRRRPENAAAAANSIPFCVAVALEHGDVTLTDIAGLGRRNPLVLRVGQRVVYRIDDRSGTATIAVTLRGGERTEAKVAALESAVATISDEQILDKFADCCSHASMKLTKTDIERITAMIRALEMLDDVRSLAALIGASRDR